MPNNNSHNGYRRRRHRNSHDRILWFPRIGRTANLKSCFTDTFQGTNSVYNTEIFSMFCTDPDVYKARKFVMDYFAENVNGEVNTTLDNLLYEFKRRYPFMKLNILAQY